MRYYIAVCNIEQLLCIKTSKWVDNTVCYLELWALKQSVLIFASLNRITIPLKWQIIPLSLSWFNIYITLLKKHLSSSRFGHIPAARHPAGL